MTQKRIDSRVYCAAARVVGGQTQRAERALASMSLASLCLANRSRDFACLSLAGDTPRRRGTGAYRAARLCAATVVVRRGQGRDVVLCPLELKECGSSVSKRDRVDGICALNTTLRRLPVTVVPPEQYVLLVASMQPARCSASVRHTLSASSSASRRFVSNASQSSTPRKSSNKSER